MASPQVQRLPGGGGLLISRAARLWTAAVSLLSVLSVTGHLSGQFSSCERLLYRPWGAGRGDLGRLLFKWPDDPSIVSLHTPADAREALGHLYVADTVNRRVVVYDCRDPEAEPSPVSAEALSGFALRVAPLDNGGFWVVQRVTGRGWLARLNSQGQREREVSELPWPSELSPPASPADVVQNLWSVGSDLYIVTEHPGSPVRCLFRVQFDAAPVLTGKLTAPKGAVSIGAFHIDSPPAPAFFQLWLEQASVATEGAQVHQCRVQLMAPAEGAREAADFQVRSRTEALGLHCIGADQSGALYLQKWDWVPRADGSYSSADMVASVLKVGSSGQTVFDQPVREFEALAAEVGVPPFEKLTFTCVGASGALYALGAHETGCSLLAFR